MKKTYKAPLTEVVKINVEQMICESVAVQGNYDSSSMTIAGKEKWDEFDEIDEDLW